MTPKEAIIVLFNDACRRLRDAAKTGNRDMLCKYSTLANAIEMVYPDEVKAIIGADRPEEQV